jgi:hypothetical protein
MPNLRIELLKQKKINPERTKVWGTVRDFGTKPDFALRLQVYHANNILLFSKMN